MTSPKPNILFIMADQLAAQALSFYGNRVCKTPNLDALAATSALFENCYCNYPLCVPSRASLLTGRLTPEIAAWDNASEIPASQPTMAHHLRHAGYHTVLTGKMHFIGPDQLHGFNERTVTDVYPSEFDWIADWSAGAAFVPSATAMNGVVEAGPAVRTLQEDYDEEVSYNAIQTIFDLARRPEQKPWFQIASFTSPHTPFTVAQEYWDRYTPEEIAGPTVAAIPFDKLDYFSKALYFTHGRHRHRVDPEHLAASRHAYYAMISFIDDKVGELLRALEKTNQRENTIIVFCSDHGEMLGERGMWFKQSFFDWSSRVPLVVHVPGQAAQRINEVVSLVDLLPTFIEIAGGEIPVIHDGQSLIPVLNGCKGRDVAISDYSGVGPCLPARMVRKGALKLIYTHSHPNLLFDMEKDPNELNNLADDPLYAAELEELLSICMTHWDPEDIMKRILASQKERKIIKTTPGQMPDWTYEARYNDKKRYVRIGTGGVDGTKSKLRLPFVEPVAPHFPPLAKDEVEAILSGLAPLPDYLS